jgi:hypothetical protein
MIKSFKKLFGKKQDPKNSNEPYIKVIDMKFDPENPSENYFELDWNKAFVDSLGEAGYAGSSDEEIVNLWFNDLCRSIAAEPENSDSNIRR